MAKQKEAQADSARQERPNTTNFMETRDNKYSVPVSFSRAEIETLAALANARRTTVASILRQLALDHIGS